MHKPNDLKTATMFFHCLENNVLQYCLFFQFKPVESHKHLCTMVVREICRLRVFVYLYDEAVRPDEAMKVGIECIHFKI